MSDNIEPRCFSCGIPGSTCTLYRHGTDWLCADCEEINGGLLESDVTVPNDDRTNTQKEHA